MFPTQPLPMKAEDFPRGDKYFMHVPLLTYLIYFSPKGVYIVTFFVAAEHVMSILP